MIEIIQRMKKQVFINIKVLQVNNSFSSSSYSSKSNLNDVLLLGEKNENKHSSDSYFKEKSNSNQNLVLNENLVYEYDNNEIKIINENLIDNKNIFQPVNLKEMYEKQESKANNMNLNENINEKESVKNIKMSEYNKKSKKTNSLIMKSIDNSINMNNLNSSMPDIKKVNIEHIHKQMNDEVS